MYGSSQNSFQDLMSMAKQNAAAAKKKAANIHLLPETGRPRKADPRDSKLKEGVAKFLAKRDEEDKRKKEMEKQKKEKLFQLRNQDRKSANRVRKMLSMTKSANKSCIEDADDCLNASVAAQGEIQPDEDDYGYTSNYADMMHKKMMEKYKSIPIKPTFPESSKVAVPKHQSLAKNGTGWRKNGSSHEEERQYSSPEQESYDEPAPSSHRKPEKTPKVPKKPAPPDYRQLLEIAQQKQLEPAVSYKPLNDKKQERDDFEFGRPMTAKEKKQFLVEKEMKDRLARRMEDKSDKNNNSRGGNTSIETKNGQMPSFKIPKARSKDEEVPANVPPSKKPRISDPEPNTSSRQFKDSSKTSRPSDPSSSASLSKPSTINKPNGFKQPTSSSSLSCRPIEKAKQSSKEFSSNSPAHSSKPKGAAPQRDRPLNTTNQVKPDRRLERIAQERMERERVAQERLERERVAQERMERERVAQERLERERVAQERMELIKERPKYLSAFDGRLERDRDSQRKQPLLSSDSNKPKPGSSRDMQSVYRDGKGYDSREKSRPGTAVKSPQEDGNRQMKGRERDTAPPSRRDAGQPPRRDMGPPPRRDMGPPPRRDMRPPSRMQDDNSPPRMKPKPFKGRAVIDSDEEYDSEMDDFIDDSEVDLGNISAEISKIFKYDRRKYLYEDSDDECMESSVAQQMREEQRSLKLGIQEDLEDMAREEEEKQRKMGKMKKRR